MAAHRDNCWYKERLQLARESDQHRQSSGASMRGQISHGHKTCDRFLGWLQRERRGGMDYAGKAEHVGVICPKTLLL